MSTRNSRTRVRAARREQNDGRARGHELIRRSSEVEAIAHLFGIDDHGASGFVANEGAQHRGRIHIGLIADRDEAREPESELAEPQVELLAEAAALRDQADAAGTHIEVRHGEQLAASVGNAEAVGPHERSAGRAQTLHGCPLASLALDAHLAQHRRHGHNDLRTHRYTVVHHGLEQLRRHREDDEFGRLRQIAKRCEGPLAEDLAAASVDQVDRAAVSASQEPDADIAAPLRGVARGADDRHRARLKERSQVSVHASPSRSDRGRTLEPKSTGRSPIDQGTASELRLNPPKNALCALDNLIQLRLRQRRRRLKAERLGAEERPGREDPFGEQSHSSGGQLALVHRRKRLAVHLAEGACVLRARRRPSSRHLPPSRGSLASASDC